MPMLDGIRWNELDHRAFDARLRQIGYDFYFVTQFGQTTFPHAPASGAWVLMDDAVRSKPADSETLPALADHRMRFPSGRSHNFDRHISFKDPRPKTTSVRKNL
jgi:hypothetical protein